MCGSGDPLGERRCSLSQETLFSRSREQRLPCWRTASFSVCLFGAIFVYVRLSCCRRFRRCGRGKTICRLGLSSWTDLRFAQAPLDGQFPRFLRIEICAQVRPRGQRTEGAEDADDGSSAADICRFSHEEADLRGTFADEPCPRVLGAESRVGDGADGAGRGAGICEPQEPERGKMKGRIFR